MSAWTRMAAWLGFGQQRAAAIDPLTAALTQRYANWTMPVTPDSAARKVAVGASIRLISNVGRTMPVHAFNGVGGTTKQLPDPVLLRDPDATGRGMADWVAQALWSVAARGNLMVQVLVRDSNGRPTAIQVLHPDLIKPQVDTDGTLLSWKVARGGTIPVRDVIHRRMYPVPGQVLGLSPIEQHAATIGIGIAAEKFGGDFFESGGHPTALLKSVAPMTEDQGKRVKSKFRIAATAREPVLLPDGISYEQIQVKPGESQFLDALGYSGTECCRIFGPGFAEALGYETGGSLTYSTLADGDLRLLKYSLDPYLVLIEDVLSSCLPKPHFVKLNRGSLLRMSAMDRFKLYQIQQQIGYSSPNQQRDLEDEAPVPWGDKPYPTTKLTESDLVGGKPAPTTGEPQ